MSYPEQEYEEMRQTKLYPKDHIRNIYKQRKIFDNKISVVAPMLDDFKEYIKFEKVVLFDFNNRIEQEKKKEQPVRNIESEKKIEQYIFNRMRNIYTKSTTAFPRDFAVWLAFYNFAREHNLNYLMGNIVEKMLQSFHDNPVSWNIAVAWYKVRSVDEGINIILKGLELHPSFENLYSHAVDLKIIKLKSDLPDASKNQVLASLNEYVKTMLQNIKNPKFICDVLKKLEPEKITINIQNMIIQFLLTNFSDETHVWKVLAQREANGFHYQADENVRSTEIYRLNKTGEKYQEGISIVCPNKKPELWSAYFLFLLNLRCQDTFRTYANEKLRLGFTEANRTIILQQHFFIEWFQLLQDKAAAEHVLKKGLNEHPKSLELWKLYLQTSCSKNNKLEFNQRFKRAISELGDNSLQIWIMAIRYHSLSSDNKVVDAIYREAIKQPEPISDIIKPLYIEYLMTFSSFRTVRKTYDKISVRQPYCKQLHKTMIRIENLESEKDLARIEKIYELAAKQFGHEDIKVRLSMITFYVNNIQGFKKLRTFFDIDRTVEETYNKGLNDLKDKPLLLEEFKASYDRLKKS